MRARLGRRDLLFRQSRSHQPFRSDLTRLRDGHKLSAIFFQALVEGKAVRFGRGPATVIGSLLAVSQDTHQCCGSRHPSRERVRLKPHSFLVGLFCCLLFDAGKSQLQHTVNGDTQTRWLLRPLAPVASGLLLLLIAAAPAIAQAEQALPPRAPSSKTFIEVTDEAGRSVRVPQPINRIVSLAPSLTELVFALGAGNRLVGDTDYCDYPSEALRKPKVGGATNPSIEQIVALHPDLVLMTKTLNRRETVLALDQLGMPSYATDPHTVESVLTSFERLGELIGEREPGQRLAESLRSRLDDLKRRIGARSPRRALFIVWLDPFITVGRDTFIADALRYAGAQSVITTAQDWPHISLEEVVRLQPEYLIFATSREESVMQHFKELTTLPGWRSLDAVRNKRLAIISDAIDRPSPRIVGAIEELARQLHPKAFQDASGAPDPRAKHLQPRRANPPAWFSSATTLSGACPSCAR